MLTSSHHRHRHPTATRSLARWFAHGFAHGVACLCLLVPVTLAAINAIAAPSQKQSNAPNADEQVDPLELAAVLTRDRHFDRADGVLRDIEETTTDLDLARLYTLKAIVALNLSRETDALRHIDAALALPEPNPLLFVLKAQACYKLSDDPCVISSVDSAAARDLATASLQLLAIQSELRREQPAAAWHRLASLPHEPKRDAKEADAIRRLKLLVLLRLNLFYEAASLVQSSPAPLSAEDAIMIAQAQIRSGSAREATHLLESARLTHPRDPRIIQLLARAHDAAGSPRAAATLLASAVSTHPELVEAAVEAHRKAQNLREALRLTAMIQDAPRRLTARIAVLTDAARYDEVLALSPRVAALKLTTNDRIRYALAYAAFQRRDDASARDWLSGIAEPSLYNAAIQLRAAIERRTPASN